MAEIFKKLRGYKIDYNRYGKGTPIADIRNYTKLEITRNNFILHYDGGNMFNFSRTRAADAIFGPDSKTPTGYTWLMDHPEAKWPNFYDTSNSDAFKGYMIGTDGEEKANQIPDMSFTKLSYTK